MLKICENFVVDLDVKYNSDKSVFMRTGECYTCIFGPLVMFGNALQQVQQMKYLSVCLVSARTIKCSVAHLKVKFYRTFNCLHARSKAADWELVTVQLVKSYGLPLLLYAVDAAPLWATNIRTLDSVPIGLCIGFLVRVMVMEWQC